MSGGYTWVRNVWTGHDLAKVSETRRLVRQTFGGAPPLYLAEEWGDYSLRYPVHGGWHASTRAALASLDRRLAAPEEETP